MTSILETLLDAQGQSSTQNRLSSRVARFVIRGAVRHLVAPFDPVVRRTVHGAQLFLNVSHALPGIVAAHPYYDTALPTFARFLLHRGGPSSKLTVVDVGANVGDTAKLIAAMTGRDRVRFVCIEADDQYLPLLRKNTDDLEVELHNVIAGQQSATTSATIIRTGAGTSAIQSGSGEGRRISSLDDLLGQTRIDLLKIDTDGFEAQVLGGATRVLSTSDAPCFIEFSPWHIRTYGKIDPVEVLSILERAGYDSAIVYDNTGYYMGLMKLGDRRRARDLIDYCGIKPHFYVDLLVGKDQGLLEAFAREELSRYAAVQWSSH